jgi:hypothetical protein
MWTGVLITTRTGVRPGFSCGNTTRDIRSRSVKIPTMRRPDVTATAPISWSTISCTTSATDVSGDTSGRG